MKQRRIQPFELGLRLSSPGDTDDWVDDPISTISFVLELNHQSDQWRGSFAFYTNAIKTSRDLFGSTAPLAVGGLSLWRYPLTMLTDLN